MTTTHLLTLGSDNRPLGVHPYVQAVGNQWVAMLVADGVTPPAPGELKGLSFFWETAEEAEQAARMYLGEGASEN